MNLRRVVTGLDREGRSTVQIDGPLVDVAGGGYVWRTTGVPADNSSSEDIPEVDFSFDLFHSGGTNFLVTVMEPGEAYAPHATDTIDYVVVMEGEVTLGTETGEVVLRRGDLVVDRGITHTWRNHTKEKCAFAVVAIPAMPVGSGRSG